MRGSSCTTARRQGWPVFREVLALLVLLAAGFAIPPVIKVAARRIGAKQVLFALTPSAGLLVLGYLAAAQCTTIPPSTDSIRSSRPFPSHRRHSVPKGRASSGSSPGWIDNRRVDLASADRYPTLLQEMVKRDHPELTVGGVFNAGMDWFTTKHSLINYDKPCG